MEDGVSSSGPGWSVYPQPRQALDVTVLRLRWPRGRRQPVLFSRLGTKRKKGIVHCCNLFKPLPGQSCKFYFTECFHAKGIVTLKGGRQRLCRGQGPLATWRPAHLCPGGCPAASDLDVLSVFPGSCIRGICLPVSTWNPSSKTFGTRTIPWAVSCLLHFVPFPPIPLPRLGVSKTTFGPVIGRSQKSGSTQLR